MADGRWPHVLALFASSNASSDDTKGCPSGDGVAALGSDHRRCLRCLLFDVGLALGDLLIGQ